MVKLPKLDTREHCIATLPKLATRARSEAKLPKLLYKCPPNVGGSVAVVEELLEDNCHYCPRQNLEDICVNIFVRVEDMIKSCYWHPS